MGLCETCEYWGDSEWEKEWGGMGPTGYKTCCHESIGDYNETIDPDFIPNNTPQNIKSDAMTSAWREMGCPMTGPKFGCIHHENRGG